MSKKIGFLLVLSLSFFLHAGKEKILCFGDSITQGTYIKGRWTIGTSWVTYANEKSKDVEFVNAGRSGRRTNDRKELKPYLKELQSYKRVLFYLGVNDLNTPKKYSPESCLENIKWMVRECRKANPKIKIAICSSPGLNMKRIKKHFYKMGYNEKENELLETLAKLYKKYCKKNKFKFIDLRGVVAARNYFDGVHPTVNGQKQTADFIWKRLYRKRAKIKIACVGDSITYGAGIKDRSKTYPAQLQKMLGAKFDVRNFGVSARTLLKRGDRPYWREGAYQDALDFAPDKVIIKLGTNDIKPKNWRLKAQIEEDLKALVESFEQLPSSPQVYLSYPVPIQASKWGMKERTLTQGLMPKIKTVATQLKLPIIDFHGSVPAEEQYFSDGIHPNAAGAKLMAEAVVKALKIKVKKQKRISNTAIIPVPKLENDFYNWEERHAAILKMLEKEKPDLVFFGDSITHMFGGLPHSRIRRGTAVWDKYYGKRKAINMGFGWDRTQNVLWRIKNGALKGAKPKVAVVMIGTNNLTGTKNARTNTPKEIAEGIKAVCQSIHQKVPKCRIILLGVLPRAPQKFVKPIQEINQRIKALGKKKYIHLLSMYEYFVDQSGLPKKALMRDTVHPNAKGYQVIAETMEPLMEKFLND